MSRTSSGVSVRGGAAAGVPATACGDHSARQASDTRSVDVATRRSTAGRGRDHRRVTTPAGRPGPRPQTGSSGSPGVGSMAKAFSAQAIIA